MPPLTGTGGKWEGWSKLEPSGTGDANNEDQSEQIGELKKQLRKSGSDIVGYRLIISSLRSDMERYQKAIDETVGIKQERNRLRLEVERLKSIIYEAGLSDVEMDWSLE